MANSVKKTIASISALSVALGVMYGCGKEKTESVPDDTTSASSIISDVSEATSAELSSDVVNTEQNGDEENRFTSWADAYKTYLKKCIAGPDYSGKETFSLHYIDADDIPELVISHGSYHAASASVIGYSSESRTYEKIIDGIGSNGVFFYEEKTGIVVGTHAGMGTRHTHVEKIQSNSSEILWDSVAVYPEWADETQTEKYEISDKAVSREEYEAQYEKFVPKNLVWVSGEEFNGAELESDGYELAKDIKAHEIRPSYKLTEENVNKYVK